MSKNSRSLILLMFLMSILIVSCQFNQDKTQISDKTTPKTIHPESNEDKDITAVLEKILIAVGNKNAQELGDLATNNATIGLTYLQDGAWMNKELTIKEYLRKIVENKNPKPIAEIAEGFDIYVSEDRLAMVKAETFVSQFGVPKSREVNNLLMIKEKDDWKLQSIAWTVHPLPEEERKFNLNLFAHTYAQVWGSKRPEFVAMFFEEGGALQVNDGDPALGRNAISDVAQSFMTQFPDMNVSFDSLVHKTNGVEFHWTLTGTDADPNGKGHKVNINGYETWTMSEGNLIKDSKGHFSSDEYKRQLEFGSTN